MASLSPQNNNQKYLQWTLQIISGVSFLVSGLLAIISYSAHYELSLNGILVAMLLSAIMNVLAWRGRLALPRQLLPALVFVLSIYIVLIGEGLRDEGVLGFALVIAMAGLLLGRLGVIAYTLADMGIVFLIGIAQMNNWIQVVDVNSFPITRIFTIEILLSFTGILTYITILNLTRVLQQVRQDERELAASNQQLQHISNTLENIVAERTRRADITRQEAEEARWALEKQMWQVSGQAQLSEVLRREQGVDTLANNTVSFLCQYLDMPVGALFLRQDQLLVLTGSYACQTGEGVKNQFEFGEGLIGQVAIDQRVEILENIPIQRLVISSGLGKVTPTQIILVPLVYSNDLVAILELGSLRSFPPEKVQFLERTAESIAIALHSSFSRLRLNELLEETQRQAEELQAQEEELRAANEVLQVQAETMRTARLDRH